MESIIVDNIEKNEEKIHFFSIDETGPFICFNPSPKTITKIKIKNIIRKLF